MINTTSIKMFISSTFVDMQEERNYLMNVVVPKMSAACSQYGLNFFCYDLRWGITNEKQKKVGTIVSCLRAVDDARPFFVGILGERYGWIPDCGIESFAEFGLDRDDISITEMEMIYGALKTPSDGFCTFAIRDSAIGKKYAETDKLQIQKLKNLKQSVRNSGYPCLDGYRSVEEFGEWLLKSFFAWLKDSFHNKDDIEYNKQRSYMAHFSDLSMGNSSLEQNIIAWMKKQKPLFIVTKGSGLNSLLMTNSEFHDGQTFDMIPINLGASNYIRSVNGIIRYILSRIDKLYPGQVDKKYLMKPITFVDTEQERKDLIMYFQVLSREIKVSRPIYFFLTDVHLLNREIEKTLYYFNGIPNENMNILVTANDCPYLDVLDSAGWHIREIIIEEAACYMIMTSKLRRSGKSLSIEQVELLRNELNLFANIEKMDLISTYLTNNVVHNELNEVISELINFEKTRGDHTAFIIGDFIERKLNSIESRMGLIAYQIIKEMDYKIAEGDLYSLLSVVVEFSSSDWVNFRTAYGSFFPDNEGYIDVTNSYVRIYLNKLAELPEVPFEQIDYAIMDLLLKKLILQKNNLKNGPTEETMRMIRKYIQLSCKNRQDARLKDLIEKFSYIFSMMALYDLSSIRIMLSSVSLKIRQELLHSFSEYCFDILSSLKELTGENECFIHYFRLLANLKTYDNENVLDPYATLDTFTLAKECTDQFKELYLKLTQLISKVDSQEKLDQWYNTASSCLEKYMYLDQPECIYALKLMSTYANAYDVGFSFRRRMTTLYTASAAIQANEYEYVQSLKAQADAYAKVGGNIKTATGMAENYQMLSKAIGISKY